MTTLYNKGVYFERLTKNWLEREGYLVMRSAGSKSPNDLAVFPMYNCKDVGLNHIHPFVIQIKSISSDKDIAWNYHLHKADINTFAQQRFNNNYIDKYLFVYDIKQKKKVPIIYKWVLVRWVLVQGPDSTGPQDNSDLP